MLGRMSCAKKHEMLCEQSSVYMTCSICIEFCDYFATAMNSIPRRDTQAQGMIRAGLALMDRYLTEIPKVP